MSFRKLIKKHNSQLVQEDTINKDIADEEAKQKMKEQLNEIEDERLNRKRV